jgi:hypothetical protein
MSKKLQKPALNNVFCMTQEHKEPTCHSKHSYESRIKQTQKRNTEQNLYIKYAGGNDRLQGHVPSTNASTRVKSDA